MPFLIAFNKILDIKIVQYALCALVVIMLLWCGVSYFKINTLKLQKAYYETEYAKVSAGLAVQNEAITQLGEEKKAQDENLQQAIGKVTELAKVNKKLLKDIEVMPLQGTCEQKIQQTLQLIRSVK